MIYRIVIPIYNEKKHVEKLLGRFNARQINKLILVDDGSLDGTFEKVRNSFPDVCIISHKINLGKGKALETGALKALDDKADIVIFMDGDLQHKPEDVNRFLRVFNRDKDLKIIFGSRKIGIHMRLMPFIGNKLLTVVTNIFFRYFLNDTQCGFRAFRADVFDKIRWESSGYAAETEMIINAAIHQLSYKEIPIDTIYLDYYKGTYIVDGIIIIFKIFIWRVFKWKL